METIAAKELLHIKGWLARVDEIVARGQLNCGARISASPGILEGLESGRQSILIGL